MTTETNHDEFDQPEIKNPAAVLAKNRELLATIKGLQTELETTKTALQAAQGDAQGWKSKWHQVAVIAPFDATLDSVSAGPAKYLRTELLERGILKMEPDADGIERIVWFTKDGERTEPADVWKFLADMNDQTLARMIRSSGASGSGASGSSAWIPPVYSPPEPEKTPTPPPAFGLR